VKRVISFMVHIINQSIYYCFFHKFLVGKLEMDLVERCQFPVNFDRTLKSELQFLELLVLCPTIYYFGGTWKWREGSGYSQ
jgi:hypothetical protein